MKPKIGIFGFSGCWGEQIVILNCEDELLDIVGAVDIVDFLGGSSVNDTDCPLTIAFVEGSIANNRQEQDVKKVRERAQLLVAVGSCACCGGVAAMKADVPRDEMIKQVYGDHGKDYDIHQHRPVHEFVKVDLKIPGCPMEKSEFIKAVSALLNGDVPNLPKYPVCKECKMQEQDCLLVTKNEPCVGPISQAGCGALCPEHNVPCIGCRGLSEEVNIDSMKEVLIEKGFDEKRVDQMIGRFAQPIIDKVREGGEL